MRPRRETFSWALYDWANSAFATSIMAGFFPVFFKQYWSAGTDITTSTFRLGLANSIGSLLLMVLAPLLGAIADRSSGKKRFLLFFMLLGAGMSGLLAAVGQGNWPLAILVFVLATVGFAGGNIFYDSLLVDVASPAESDRVSALGFSLGYLGGGLLFAVNVLMTVKPALFGLADAGQAVRLSFVTVALWWVLFSLPLFRWVPETPGRFRDSGLTAVREGFAQLRRTFGEIRTLRVVCLFLLAYWLYIDAVDTIIRMAVDYGMSLGFHPNSLILALLLTQFVGFPAALVFGRLGERLGTKRAIFAGLAVYLLVTVWAMFMQSVGEFYGLAVVIGLVQGGVQALSRSLYSRLIPPGRAAEFFGFYNMLGKFAAIIGPFLMGWLGVLTGNPRLSLIAVIILFAAGGLLLSFVNEEEGARLAGEHPRSTG